MKGMFRLIKQIWTIRSLPKLFNGLNLSVSLFMLFYTILNVIFLDNLICYKLLFFGNNLPDNSKYLLFIIPVIGVMVTLFLSFYSNVPKKIKYEINEITRYTALKDYKNHREYLIGLNFLITLTIAFVGIDSLTLAKGLNSFLLLPAAITLFSIIPFALYKYNKMKVIYEI